MAETLIALKQLNLGLLLSDGLSALQIAASDSTANQDEFQQTVLSQIRRMIWGDDLANHWNTDFIAAGVKSLQQLSAGSSFQAAVCQAGDALGAAVRVAGNYSGGLLNVTSADPTALSTMPAIGIIVDKPAPNSCLVQLSGIVDLSGAGLTAGSRYWVGAGGALSASVPTPATGGEIYVQVLGVAVDANYLDLQPSLNLLRLAGPVAPASPLYPFAMPFGAPVSGGSGPMP